MLLDSSSKTITLVGLQNLIASTPDNVQLLDVRDTLLRTQGQIPNSKTLDDTTIPDWVKTAKAPKLVVLYCAVGLRSASLADEWHALGHTNVVSLIGGFNAWEQAGLPISTQANSKLSSTQHQRYSRQIQLAKIGVSGQEKLLQSRVLIIGMGGLGCPASQYLVASGVGHIGLVDFDSVELSNLQRQVLFRETDIGQLKVDCAKRSLQNLNEGIQIQTFPVRLDADNARAIISKYDIIVHGSDNFATRYLVNQVCHDLQKTLVEGAVQEFGGQVAVFDFREAGPCYQCVFPSAPPTDSRLSCTDIGVLGVLPGLLGTMQATEVLKLILDLGIPLRRKLLIYDGLTATSKILAIKQNPACQVCGHS